MPAHVDAWVEVPLVVVDVETSGLNPEVDRVVEIGIVLYRAGREVAHYGTFVKPGDDFKMPEDVRRVHGIGDDQIQQGLAPIDVLLWIVQHLRGYVPVAYNVPFDRSMLMAEAFRACVPQTVEAVSTATQQAVSALLPEILLPDTEWVDPLVWARHFQKYEKSKKLADVAQRLGVSIAPTHRALDDARATGEVLMKLAGKMPKTWGELVSRQRELAVQQEKDFAAWRARKGLT